MKEMPKRECLLMFSGGYDTLLAAPLLVEGGYKTLLITYDNGMEIGLDCVSKNVERLQKAYGNRIQFLGIKPIVGTFRRFLIPYMLGEIDTTKFGILPTEAICLMCRSAMYIHSIAEALNRGIKFIAEGARESQEYPEQQSEIVDIFRTLCERYDINLLLPVFDLEGKRQVKEELTIRAIVPKTREPSCVMAMPLYAYKPMEERTLGMQNMLNELILPQADNIIETIRKINRSRNDEVDFV